MDWQNIIKVFTGINQGDIDTIIKNPWALAVALLLVAWLAIWKGVALWKAARIGSKPWFIAILILNTVGILEILYIFYFSKKKKEIQNS